jgi:hypothetical protein
MMFMGSHEEPTSSVSDDKVTALARLQSFDGAFALDSRLVRLLFGTASEDKLKSSIPASVKGTGKADSIWATVVACKFLEVKLTSEKEVWEGMWEKAKTFVETELTNSGLNVPFEELAKEAAKLF